MRLGLHWYLNIGQGVGLAMDRGRGLSLKLRLALLREHLALLGQLAMGLDLSLHLTLQWHLVRCLKVSKCLS